MDMNLIFEKALEYGVLGVISLSFAWYILRKDKDIKEMADNFISSQKEINNKFIESYNENTKVLVELSTIIKTNSKK